MVVTRQKIARISYFSLVLGLLLLGCPLLQTSYARADNLEVNWESLDLSSSQRQQLNQLDHQWKSTVCQLAPRIQTNEKKLKQLMSSPDPRESEILHLQQQIHEDKARLKMDATQIYLNKRRILNHDQQEKLQRILNLY